jgi:ribulose-5-phosphate 4-epimerase/fuculose-1-phosphate aldolase
MATERELRQQLAAAYRLAALFGWEDTLYTHFSVRLPGDGEPRFLINPFGMMFDEVTASNLIVVDMQGKVVEGTRRQTRRDLPSTARSIWPGKTPTA